MIRILPNVLSAAELQAVRELLPQVRFADGRITNPDSTIKQNLQAPQEDPANQRIALIARDALMRFGELRVFAQPRTMARTTVVRYEPGMNYGWHVDEALFPSTPPIRSDLSCTVFLNDPSEYDGGELTIQLGAQELAYKLEPGSAILYPSTTIHRVTPVTRGVRIAAITWLQSWVADSNQRELLVQLEEARGLAASGGDRQRLQVLLESLRTNLFRMWADT
ncbi:Fe2+-dependent dioxygenase [Lysobacter soli]|uniref:Fe2+-dependent dioxygenase n=1 Tax=Lysobacter soli TaxID=453783 RepID=UPI0012ED260E|nr:Fe2+-dependent dioxygenase [Lysobacter soli]MDG2517712.1 Fe2+-dependent dioxygenase [Lysobacter soli]QGW66716.1 Fe2+-dependent dioxygenase [Lysobacter soli]UTA54810.1 Fe2+-dependent dioxygenase [Lysobacter soli]